MAEPPKAPHPGDKKDSLIYNPDTMYNPTDIEIAQPKGPIYAPGDKKESPVETDLSPTYDTTAPVTPQLTRRDPSVPTANTSKSGGGFDAGHTEVVKEPCGKKCKRFLYNPEDKTFCGRTCFSWLYIIVYAIMYLIFLTTFTLILLYISLILIKQSSPDFYSDDFVVSLLTYSADNIGITGTPLSEHNYPLIWYRTGEADDYNKYIKALDMLLEKKRDKRGVDANLGPCGKPPYGYWEKPCIIIRINKQLKWAGTPLEPGSFKMKTAPVEVQKWVQKDSKKYWLHCRGFHNYDIEHIGKIQYYPDPPGFDSTLFPLINTNSSPPLVAIQVSNFTMGISLAIECKLWYESGSSSVAFMLYVTPKKSLRYVSPW